MTTKSAAAAAPSAQADLWPSNINKPLATIATPAATITQFHPLMAALPCVESHAPAQGFYSYPIWPDPAPIPSGADRPRRHPRRQHLATGRNSPSAPALPIGLAWSPWQIAPSLRGRRSNIQERNRRPLRTKYRPTRIYINIRRTRRYGCGRRGKSGTEPRRRHLACKANI